MSLWCPNSPLDNDEEQYCEYVGTGQYDELEAIRIVWPKYTQSYQYQKKRKLINSTQIQNRIAEIRKKYISTSSAMKDFRLWQKSIRDNLKDREGKNWSAAASIFGHHWNKQLDRESMVAPVDGREVKIEFIQGEEPKDGEDIPQTPSV